MPSRGTLDTGQTDKVATTVRKCSTLSDFEPRRWFAALRRKPNHDKEADATSGIASLQAAEEGEEADDSVKLVERSELRRLVVDYRFCASAGASPSTRRLRPCWPEC